MKLHFNIYNIYVINDILHTCPVPTVHNMSNDYRNIECYM